MITKDSGSGPLTSSNASLDIAYSEIVEVVAGIQLKSIHIEKDGVSEGNLKL